MLSSRNYHATLWKDGGLLLESFVGDELLFTAFLVYIFTVLISFVKRQLHVSEEPGSRKRI